ncbi:Histone-lysine N-methyltransferase EHMT2 [Gossypium arboreum]|uniref:Histone-lysine N-methyltransferase EHMT2 n=2 Tax=Gossypium arboreum TaxID=29729 RepID=A0A0B0NFZ2_GOSAR|nr:uncharacterized protein LOC108486800 [Gossypium arboreum]KAK5829920.1 hypothetical protein PVK06_013714 [Gossypium arboreum]KHG11755.1 Histone-lysine N-methyltransferase EHMT2 [Gossypium arboreum]
MSFQLKTAHQLILKMRKLARQIRNSEDDKFSLPTVDDARPMDINEQEELVRSLEKMQAHQSLQWKSVFAALLFCYSAFLLYSIYQQTLFPWELRYHAYFMEDVDSWIIITADWLAVLACSMAIMGLFNNSKDHRKWIWYSCSIGLVLAIFWVYYMLRMPKFRWDVIWLPLGPLCGAGVCLYVDNLLSESSEEVRKLRSYMYAFKAG